jgi:long-chain fatty acid transport protein
MTTQSSRAAARGGVVLLTAATIAASAGPASAGGMLLHTRGVRPSARGGAFVAGADDLGAMWFNPAGLAHLADEGANNDKNDSFLFDAAFVSQSASYTRIDSGYNAQPTVSNQAPGIPVPSIAYAHKQSDRLVISGGLWAPYAGLSKFDATGPQRYTSIDLSETLLFVLGVGVGFKVTDHLRIGATVQNMSFFLASTVAFGGCPGQTVCSDEDPEFDAGTKLTSNAYFVPSASVGGQIDLGDHATFGAALQAPYKVSGGGKIETRLPSSGFYNGTTLEGDRADVDLTLPASLRAGLEAHADRVRVEAAIDYELWSMHKDLTITPKDVRLVNAPGVGTYELGPVVVPRHYKNSLALSLGLETQPLPHLPLHVLAGYTYETGAAPTKYLSTLTIDGDKHVFALGATFAFGRWRVDAMASYFKMGDRTVETCNPMVADDCESNANAGQSPQLTPLRDNAQQQDALHTYVNWGTYKSSWLAIGLGLNASF